MARSAAKPTPAPEPQDHGESVTMMTPPLLSDEAKRKAELNDLTLDLVARSAGFCRRAIGRRFALSARCRIGTSSLRAPRDLPGAWCFLRPWRIAGCRGCSRRKEPAN